VAPPFKVAEFDIMYNEGISKVGDVLDLGVQMGVVEKRGSFYTYGEAKIGQGRENAKQYLKDNPDLAEGIEMRIRDAAQIGSAPLDFDKGEGKDQPEDEA
jgi:recombination protein RecA